MYYLQSMNYTHNFNVWMEFCRGLIYFIRFVVCPIKETLFLARIIFIGQHWFFNRCRLELSPFSIFHISPCVRYASRVFCLLLRRLGWFCKWFRVKRKADFGTYPSSICLLFVHILNILLRISFTRELL